MRGAHHPVCRWLGGSQRRRPKFRAPGAARPVARGRARQGWALGTARGSSRSSGLPPQRSRPGLSGNHMVRQRLSPDAFKEVVPLFRTWDRTGRRGSGGLSPAPGQGAGSPSPACSPHVPCARPPDTLLAPAFWKSQVSVQLCGDPRTHPPQGSNLVSSFNPLLHPHRDVPEAN